jgi:predicted kinase
LEAIIKRLLLAAKLKNYTFAKMKSLYLLRGLPGSGKSTLAESLSENGKYPVFSIDSYFTDSVTGAYSFEFDKNHIAYSECVAKTKSALVTGEEKVIVDNTFTMEWEMKPYFDLASEFNYRLFVMTIEKYHDGKNIHEVTEQQLQKMAVNYKVKLY